MVRDMREAISRRGHVRAKSDDFKLPTLDNVHSKLLELYRHKSSFMKPYNGGSRFIRLNLDLREPSASKISSAH